MAVWLERSKKNAKSKCKSCKRGGTCPVYKVSATSAVERCPWFKENSDKN